MAYGLWPMVRRVAVSGATRALRCMVRRKAVSSATRALRCRDWHEIRVDERTDMRTSCQSVT
eukprot:6385317-Prymnesium_polylepis.1